MVDRGQALGALEHIVLLAVLRLGKEAYGVSVVREIESATGRRVSIGAAYATLLRLESKGFVVSEPGEPTPERGGRTKRFYRMTASGRQILRDTSDMLRRMSAGLRELGT